MVLVLGMVWYWYDMILYCSIRTCANVNVNVNMKCGGVEDVGLFLYYICFDALDAFCFLCG